MYSAQNYKQKNYDRKIEHRLSLYFNRYELKNYSPAYATEARRKFVEWGKNYLLMQGRFKELLELLNDEKIKELK